MNERLASPAHARRSRTLAAPMLLATLLAAVACAPRAAERVAAEPRREASDARAVRAGHSPDGTYFELTGPAHADVVVLVHASGVDLRMWDRETASLRTRFRVLRYDLRGHGRTLAVASPRAPFDELRGLLDELGIARAAVVGLSAGASIATDFAIAYPDRVTRLLLVSPSIGGYVPTDRPDWFDGIARAARAGDAEGAARLFAESPLMAIDPPDAPASPEARRLRTLIMENARVWTDTSRRAAGLSPSAITRLGEVTAPTLVLVGERDVADVHLIADRIVTGMRSARKTTIPGAGHMLTFSARATFDATLAEFLGATLPAR